MAFINDFQLQRNIIPSPSPTGERVGVRGNFLAKKIE